MQGEAQGVGSLASGGRVAGVGPRFTFHTRYVDVREGIR